MESASGTAGYVRRSAEVYGNKEGVGTSQIITFRIGSQAVQLTMPAPPQIEEGDEVVVAGDVKDGTLHGRAYYNHSNGTSGRWAKQSLILHALCAIFIMLLFTGALTAVIGPFSLLTIPVVGGWWIRDLLFEMKTRRALQIARSSALV
jgi:hypothetical protein